MLKNLGIQNINFFDDKIVGQDLNRGQGLNATSNDGLCQPCLPCEDLDEKLRAGWHKTGAPKRRGKNIRAEFAVNRLYLIQWSHWLIPNSVIAYHGVSGAADHALVLEPALVAQGASHGGVEIVTSLWASH